MKLTILSVIISLLPLIACDVCEPGYFWSSKLGCNKCFCSGVSDKCHAGSFYIETVLPDKDRVKGFVDWPKKPVGPLIVPNELDYEYKFNKADASGAFIWELSFPFHGNGARSYGGLLSFHHKTKLIGGGVISDELITIYILSSEVNISIAAMPVTRRKGDPKPVALRYNVQLTEHNAYRDGDRSRPATRADMIRSLISANKILLVSGSEANKESVNLLFIMQEVAVDSSTPGESIQETDTIEVCDCPEGYSGDSCESCKGPVCEPCKNIEPCQDQCNASGICLGCPECYECRWYHRNINNRAASVFGACELGRPE